MMIVLTRCSPLSLRAVALSLFGLSSAVNISSSISCGAQCQTLAQAGASWEATQHASSGFEFYTIPSNFSSQLPEGSLLGLEVATDLSNFSVPSGLSLSRIKYTTSDLNGTILPASAYILWPYAPLAVPRCRSGGFPLVAWAHGTSGWAKTCAPSNYRNLQYHFMAPFLLALQGMVVVAPDYAGLGFDMLPSGQHIRHPWLTGPAQANDLANAIKAARAAFPDLLRPTGPFVAMGHSQGGGAAWSFAENQVSKPVAGYKGTVAIAPPTRIIDQVDQAMANTSLPFAGVTTSVQPNIIAAVTAVYPSYNFSGMTPTSYDRWNNVLMAVQGCFPTDNLVFSDLKPDQFANPGWTEHPTVQSWAKRAETGRKRFKGPLLVLSGEADIVIPSAAVQSAVDDTCNMLKSQGWDESLELITYGGMNHFPSVQASQNKWLEWIKERLSDGPGPYAGCTRSRVGGFRTEFMAQTPFPNFLGAWADAADGWMYTL
ncbi:putative secretory lipase [Coniochaeta sp. 2T2.1]|nr:putative secretory lipase [Coniochaeta sp. 2T2.1]